MPIEQTFAIYYKGEKITPVMRGFPPRVGEHFVVPAESEDRFRVVSAVVWSLVKDVVGLPTLICRVQVIDLPEPQLP